MGEGCVVLIAVDCPSTRIIYHALRREFGRVAVVFEPPVHRWQFIRNRMRSLGLLTVCGQLGFMAGLYPILKRAAKLRIQNICDQHALDVSPVATVVSHIPSVNSPEARELIEKVDPAVIVINGTRIIGRDTLRAIRCPAINTHMGITPLYRGVHGGYWALAEGRPDLVGTTVHLVDQGIDTGRIIGQATFPISPEDSFVTYPFLHIAAGLPILVDAVRAALNGTLEPRDTSPVLSSRLRHHPTLWGYLVRRSFKGIR